MHPGNSVLENLKKLHPECDFGGKKYNSSVECKKLSSNSNATWSRLNEKNDMRNTTWTSLNEGEDMSRLVFKTTCQLKEAVPREKKQGENTAFQRSGSLSSLRGLRTRVASDHRLYIDHRRYTGETAQNDKQNAEFSLRPSSSLPSVRAFGKTQVAKQRNDTTVNKCQENKKKRQNQAPMFKRLGSSSSLWALRTEEGSDDSLYIEEATRQERQSSRPSFRRSGSLSSLRIGGRTQATKERNASFIAECQESNKIKDNQRPAFKRSGSFSSLRPFRKGESSGSSCSIKNSTQEENQRPAFKRSGSFSSLMPFRKGESSGSTCSIEKSTLGENQKPAFKRSGSFSSLRAFRKGESSCSTCSIEKSTQEEREGAESCLRRTGSLSSLGVVGKSHAAKQRNAITANKYLDNPEIQQSESRNPNTELKRSGSFSSISALRKGEGSNNRQHTEKSKHEDRQSARPTFSRSGSLSSFKALVKPSRTYENHKDEEKPSISASKESKYASIGEMRSLLQRTVSSKGLKQDDTRGYRSKFMRSGSLSAFKFTFDVKNSKENIKSENQGKSHGKLEKMLPNSMRPKSSLNLIQVKDEARTGTSPALPRSKSDTFLKSKDSTVLDEICSTVADELFQSLATRSAYDPKFDRTQDVFSMKYFKIQNVHPNASGNVFVFNAIAQDGNSNKVHNMIVLRHESKVNAGQQDLTLVNPIALCPDGMVYLLSLGSIARLIRLSPDRDENRFNDEHYLNQFRDIERWAPRSSTNELKMIPHHELTPSENGDEILQGCQVFTFQTRQRHQWGNNANYRRESVLLVEVGSEVFGRRKMLITADMFQPKSTKVVTIPRSWKGAEGISGQKRLRDQFQLMLSTWTKIDMLVGSSGTLIRKDARGIVAKAIETSFPEDDPCPLGI